MNRLLLVLSLALYFFSSFASDEVFAIRESALRISLDRFSASKRDLEAAIEKCDRLGRRVVPANVLAPLKMGVEELKAALHVLNRRAEQTCEGGARERLYFAANAHKMVAEHYGVTAGDAASYAGDLLSTRHWVEMEFEARYLHISQETRERLEAMEELKKPFSVFATLDGVDGAWREAPGRRISGP